MVIVSHPIRPSFWSAQVSRFFFQPCRDDYDEIIDEYFRCRCGTVRKQTRRNGFTNLLQHVRLLPKPLRVANVGHHEQPVARILRKSSYKTDPICIETLRSTMEGITLAVERSIVSEMPEIFGLILDGWTHLSEHYIAVFACYEVNGEFLANMLPRDFGKQL
ncbi:hypothetical protein F443_08087 [Phytophthora nicotianae P1569]|uniref:Uncharacterized protein n=1 Tax=Phytophthora nicotianae P1569 TaxID=1317065 RepID=V9FAK5_PHYNI|nr:hypothetical protein F443_08087 [Phytophthora nicotianae P1569]